MMNSWEDIEGKSRVWSEGMREGRSEWMREGRSEWMREGVEKGRRLHCSKGKVMVSESSKTKPLTLLQCLPIPIRKLSGLISR